MQNNTKPHICAYCGSSDNLTKDHVPPKNLFPKPKPNNLITVHACPNCHSKTTAKDDEYFRVKICLRYDAGQHKSARANWNSIFRSFHRPKAIGLKKQIISDLRYIDLTTNSGLYVGKTLGYNVEMKRIRSVVERIVRGLYFTELKYPLGMTNKVRVYDKEDLELQPKDLVDKLKTTILIPLSTLTPQVIGDDIFIYRCQIYDKNPIYSVWALLFYGCVYFFALTGPEIINTTPRV
jgi:hypothetical protein